ncbi:MULTISPECIES: polysaccharide biosynthesis protein [unclassified Virgibacillus]|uniref:putative polysaccharide biosynthesis protein n=1 Tax=unclassified Virgibacillus TaxID=2620237 RepID=UPI0024DEBD87|nr:polysaccharide biosynthesis protein [Virgibacillus sp. LDC-1]
MEPNETNRLLKGALLLTLAGIASKILSAGYRVPLQNLTGDFGFYVYQQVYPILGIALVLALYGFPAAISKLKTDFEAEQYPISFRNFYFPIFVIVAVVNVALFLGLQLNAHPLAQFIGDDRLVSVYQTVAFIFLFIPFTAFLRGVFQANHQMKPTAYSQVMEQFVRVLIIIAGAVIISKQEIDIYSIGKVAGIASISGSIAACIVLIFFMRKYRPPLLHKASKTSVPWFRFLRKLIILGVVASITHMVLLIIQFADTISLVPALLNYGLTKEEAMVAKGIFDRGQPLIQLGTVLGSSFALAFMPAVSKRNLKQQFRSLCMQIESGLVIGFYLAIGATVGLIMIFPAANILLYQDSSGTTVLQLLMLAIVLSALSITVASVLQGLGMIKRTAVFIGLAFLLKWGLNLLLVPFWGLLGGSIATILSLLLFCILVLYSLKRYIPTLSLLRKIKWPAFIRATLSMMLYVASWNWLLPNPDEVARTTLLLIVTFISLTGGGIYMLLLIRGNVFTQKELAMLPFASFFIQLTKEGNKKHE